MAESTSEQGSQPIDAEALRLLFAGIVSRYEVDCDGPRIPLVDAEHPDIVDQLARLSKEPEPLYFVIPYNWLTKEEDAAGQYKVEGGLLVLFNDEWREHKEAQSVLEEYRRRNPYEGHTYVFDGPSVLDSQIVDFERGGRDERMLDANAIGNLYAKFNGPNIMSWHEFRERHVPANLRNLRQPPSILL